MPATQVLEQTMNMPQIKAKARELGITPGKMKKVELIHSIQLGIARIPTAASGRTAFE